MKLLKDGKSVIASNLCGIHIPINGMYVIYNTMTEAAAPDADSSYLTMLRSSPGRGYARVPVTATKLEGDGKILFTGMVTDKDFLGGNIPQGAMLTAAVLVHMNTTDANKDMFVYSTILNNQMKIIPGTCIVVNVGISIGD